MFKISKFSKIFLFLFLSLLLFLPFFVSAVTFTPEVGIQGEGTYAITKGVGYEMGTNPGDTIFKYFGAIYSWGIRAVGIIAVVMMMVAGFQWMSAGGNAQAVAAAKGRMMNALMGLILIIGAYWLLSFINPALVQAPNLNIGGITGEEIKIGDMCSQCKSDEKCAQETLAGRTLPTFGGCPGGKKETELAPCLNACNPGGQGQCPTYWVESVSQKYTSKGGDYYFCCRCKSGVVCTSPSFEIKGYKSCNDQIAKDACRNECVKKGQVERFVCTGEIATGICCSCQGGAGVTGGNESD